MKRMLLVLLLGVWGGVGAHLAWFHWRQPAFGPDADGALAWLRTDLGLTAEQFARVKAVHEQSGPRIRLLAAQAAQLRDELAAFEYTRRTDGRIDFLAFARLVEQRRALDRACLESTRRLLASAASEMTPGQKARYLQRFGPVLGPDFAGLN